MGRSNTLPVAEPRDSQSSKAPITSGATTSAHAAPSQSHRHFKIPFLGHGHVVPDRAVTTNASRPAGLRRENSVQTRYMDMLLALDTIPRLHNILSSFFTWVLLAGFIIFPGTFTSIANLDNSSTVQDNHAASVILQSVKNIPLLVVAGVCSGIGAIGMVWLWWVWRQNYVWLLNKIFLPGCLNSLAGLISTLINVYSQQSGNWSVTAKVTAIVTGACMVITGLLFALYNFWVLEKVRRSHGYEMESEAVPEGETFTEKVERKAMEPGLEPGSVV